MLTVGGTVGTRRSGRRRVRVQALGDHLVGEDDVEHPSLLGFPCQRTRPAECAGGSSNPSRGIFVAVPILLAFVACSNQSEPQRPVLPVTAVADTGGNMKRACLVALIGWLVPAPAVATSCTQGSLASYLALGGGGCSIGTAQFFNFVDLPLQGGAFAIPDSNVLVNPLGAANPGFRFSVNSQAGAGDTFERVIGFSLSGPGFLGSQLTLSGSTVTGLDGAVTVLAAECLGAAFGAGQFCSGIDAQLGGFDLGTFGQQLTDSNSFAPTSLLGRHRGHYRGRRQWWYSRSHIGDHPVCSDYAGHSRS